uniref:BPTI/Kunitz inhibitor domain-containing protein n=1 Tax=Parastrongyloides trichosuri TaxID=131310 RepID=A0A0N4ZV39_PARTI
MMNESTNDFVTALTKEYIEVEGLPKKDEPLINKDDHFVTEKEKLNEKSKKSEPSKYKQILWNAMSFFDQYFNVKQKDIKERVKKAYIKDKIEKMKFQELDEMGCEVSSNFRKELETLRKTEIVGNNLFSCEKLVKFTEDFKRIEKIIPNSYVLYEIEKNLRMGNDIPYKEIPKLYNDKEAILYTNLIQPDVPEINQNFKLRDLLEDYIEQSSIQAQNALRREDIEFKGFWSTFVCFFLVSANPQTFIYLPIMIYEYGFYFYIYLSVAQFIICYPLIVFVISMSQYSGLGSSRLYSRIKKIWRGIEYVVLLRAFYSILLFVSETQFTTKSIFALGHKIFHEEIYLESCMSREGGCVNLGFIHPCSTGYERDIANNRICRDINQVSMEIYNDKRIKIKTISLNLFIAKFSKELIVFGDDLSEYLTPLIGISLTSILMTLGKTRIIAVVGVFTIPFIIGQTIGLLSLTTNDWQLELNQFCNVEFFPTMPMLFTILKIAIRSVNAVDLLPKISASVPHTIKTPKLALLIILSNILISCNCTLIKEHDICHPSMKGIEIPIFYCNEFTNKISYDDMGFLLCDSEKEVFEKYSCSKGSFFTINKGCSDPTKDLFRYGHSSTGSGKVGDSCQFNTDCLSGMYCSTGVCACLSTYILRESYCYEIINPNSAGCVYDAQCQAVFPLAHCSLESGIGTCKCPEKTHLARETRDGWVCVSLIDNAAKNGEPNEDLHFICPLPEGAGFKIALSDPNKNFDGLPVACTTGSTATIEPIPSLHGGAGCIWPSSGEYIGDIYDCIHTSPLINLKSKYPLSSYNPTANGVCCPSRALTCSQPAVSGSNPTEARWWFNSITGNCQQFLWDPIAPAAGDHSPNNFKTMEHCQSYCRDTCPRSYPQYNKAKSILKERPLTSCSTTTTCGNDYQCKNIGSEHLCCPTVTSICSVKGGRTLENLLPRQTIYHSGFLSKTGKEQIRFYYNHENKRCESFIYKGAGGNFNNFITKHECEMFCSRLVCEIGNPLKIGDEAQKCDGNHDCPSSYSCNLVQKVCCPKKQTVCAQPLRTGDCSENLQRFYYNPLIKQCVIFSYSGCQGNDNNFQTLLECQETCRNALPEPKCPQGQAFKDTYGNYVQCNEGAISSSVPNYFCFNDGQVSGLCPTKTYTCSLNSDKGVQCGAGTSFKYFYNSNKNSCEAFQFLGCDGNSNNFQTLEACEEYCGIACPNGGQPLRDHHHQLLSCSDNESCPATHECTELTLKSVNSKRCCPTRSHICSQPPQVGTSCVANTLTRYYFNIVTSQCSSFQYNGCNGNLNNFISETQCNNFCKASSCSAGESVFLDPNTNVPLTCNENLKNACPSNYVCTLNSFSNSHVCCGATDMGVCPDGEKAYVNALDMTAKECTINQEGSCPSNYLCRFHLQKKKYYCCSGPETCPVGRYLYKNTKTMQPIKCNINGNENQCPTGYSCQSYLKNAFQGFCCSNSDICPNNEEFLIDSSSNQPRICTMGSFISCPTNYYCKSSDNGSSGYCCKGAPLPKSNGCPPGEYALISGGQIKTCDPFNIKDFPCDSGFTCQWSISNMGYQCCSGQKPSEYKKDDGCPRNQKAFYENDHIRTCTAGGSDCPLGYFCEFSFKNVQFQCCATSGGCPANSVASIGINGEPEKCVIGQSQCRKGYSCQKTDTNSYHCCTISFIEKKCKDNELSFEGRCLPMASDGEKCERNIQCRGGGICLGNTCTCPKRTILVDGYCHEIPECLENEVLIDRICYEKSLYDGRCLSHKQCPKTTFCIKGICNCRKKEYFNYDKNKCIKENLPIVVPSKMKSKRIKTRRMKPITRVSITDKHSIDTNIISDIDLQIHKCYNTSLVPFIDPRIGRPQYCSPKTNTCALGYNCEMNLSRQNFICCGNKNINSEILNLQTEENVCPKGRIPYLLNGTPQKCTKTRCSNGYQCIYTNNGYFCCSENILESDIPVKNSIPMLSEICPRGSLLIYPLTNSPVQCHVNQDNCPLGYTCEKSISVTYDNVCCSLRIGKDISYLTNGRVVERSILNISSEEDKK